MEENFEEYQMVRHPLMPLRTNWVFDSDLAWHQQQNVLELVELKKTIEQRDWLFEVFAQLLLVGLADL